MNQETREQLGMREEEPFESSVQTCCPQCPSKRAQIIKTTNFLILDCGECGFSMGSPREEKLKQ